MTPNQSQPMTRGDIYMANLPKISGSAQRGTRPVLIIQNDVGNKYAPTVIVAPLTLQHKRKGDGNKPTMPTHIQLANNTLKSFKSRYFQDLWMSVIVFEQITTLDKQMLFERIGKTDILSDMEAAILAALGMEG